MEQWSIKGKIEQRTIAVRNWDQLISNSWNQEMLTEETDLHLTFNSNFELKMDNNRQQDEKEQNLNEEDLMDRI